MAVIRMAGAVTGDLSELDTTSITGVSVADRQGDKGKAYKIDASAISTTNTTIFGSVSGSPTTVYGHFRFSFEPSFYSDTTNSLTAVRLWSMFSSATQLGLFVLNSYDDGNTSTPGEWEIVFIDNSGGSSAWAALNANTEYAVSFRLVINGASSTLDFYINGNPVCVSKTVNCGTTSGLTLVNGFSRSGTNLRGTVWLTDLLLDDSTRYNSIRIINRQGRAGTPTHNAFSKTGGTDAYEVWSDTPVGTGTYASSASSGAAQTMLAGRVSRPRDASSTPHITASDTVLASQVWVNARTSATSGGGASASIRRIVNGSTTDNAITLTTSNAMYSTPLFTATRAHLDDAEIGFLHGANTRTHTVNDVWLATAYSEARIPPLGCLVFAGAEVGDSSEFMNRALPSGVDVSTSNAISGAASYRRSLATSGTVSNTRLLACASLTRAFINFRFKTDASVGSPASTLYVHVLTAYHPGGYVITGNTYCFYVTLVFATNGTVSLQFYNRSDVQLGSSISITEGTEYRIAIDWTGGSGATGAIKVYVNGASTPSINVSSTDVGQAMSVLTGLGKSGGTVAATYTYFDDFAISDDKLRYGVRVLSRGARNATPTYTDFTLTGGATIDAVWDSATGTTGTYAASGTSSAIQTAWLENFRSTQTGRGSQYGSTFGEVLGFRYALFGKTSSISSGGGVASIRRRVSGWNNDISISLTATDRRHITGSIRDYPLGAEETSEKQIGIAKGATTATHTIYDMWAVACFVDVNDRVDEIVFMAGAESRDTSDLADTADYSTTRIETSSPISGGASYRVDGTTAANNLTYFEYVGDYTGELYFACRFRLSFDAAPASTQAYRLIRAYQQDFATQCFYIRVVVESGGNASISIVNAANSSVGSYTFGTYTDTAEHVVVCRVTFGSGSSDGSAQLWLDGTSRINVSSQSFGPLGNAVGVSVDVTATGTKYLYIDDIMMSTKVLGPAGGNVPRIIARPVGTDVPMFDQFAKTGGSTIDAVWDNVPYSGSDYVSGGSGGSNGPPVGQTGKVRTFENTVTNYGSSVVGSGDTLWGASVILVGQTADGSNTFNRGHWPVFIDDGDVTTLPMQDFGSTDVTHAFYRRPFKPRSFAALNALDIGVVRRPGTSSQRFYGAWLNLAYTSNNALVAVSGQSLTASVGTATTSTDVNQSVTSPALTSSVGTAEAVVSTPVSVNVTSPAMTSFVGDEAASGNASTALTTNLATVSLGNESVIGTSITSVTGEATAVSLGTVTVNVFSGAEVTGQQVAITLGNETVVINVSIAETGFSLPVSTQSVTVQPDTNVLQDGFGLAASVGQAVVRNHSEAVTGQALTASLTSVAVGIGHRVTGQSVTASVGTVTVPHNEFSVTGNLMTTAANLGTVRIQVYPVVSGQQVAVTLGNELVDIDVLVAETGFSLPISVGTVSAGVQTTVTPTGLSMTPSTGTVGFITYHQLPVTGVSATITTGFIAAGTVVEFDQTAGVGAVSVSGLAAAFGSYQSQLANPASDRIHLVEMYLGGFDETVIFAGTDLAINMNAINTLGEAEGNDYFRQTPLNIYLSDYGWTSRYDDPDMPSVHFDGRVTVAGSFLRQIPLTPEQSSRANIQVGRLSIINTDRAYDTLWETYPVAGRQIRVLVGSSNQFYSGFMIIGDMAGIDTQSGEQELVITLRDKVENLDNTLIQTVNYDGAGEAGGTTNHKGKPKPLLFGHCENVTPVDLGVTGYYIFQVHDGVVSAISSVYDMGAPLTLDTAIGTSGDFANYADLKAATIGSGKYATCKAQGMFRVATPPTGRVTCDVLGDASGAGYVESPARIAERMLGRYSSTPAITIDTAKFDALHTARNMPSGVYIVDQVSIATAVSIILSSIAAWWGTSRDGKVVCDYLREPDSGSSVATITYADILQIDQVPLPDTVYPPNSKRVVNYQPNWTPMTESEIAGAVSQSRKDFLTKEYRTATKTGVGLTKFFSRTNPPALNSLLHNEANAITIAEYLYDLHGVQRRAFRVVIKTSGHSMFLGDTIYLQYPRFGLSGGAYFRVIGLEEDLSQNGVTLTVWG